LNLEHVTPFIEPVVRTFETMVGESARPGEPKLKTVPFPICDISGAIGFSGGARGVVCLAFPMEVALGVVSRMLGSPVEADGEEVVDAVGELANIVAGYAKKNLVEYCLSISLPNVVVGPNHTLSVPKDTEAVIVPFTCRSGSFTMEVALKRKRNVRQPASL